MSFYDWDEAIARAGERLVAVAARGGGHGRLRHDQLALTLVLPARGDGRPRGFSYRGDVPTYPASVIKLFYLVATQAWLETGRLSASAELKRALVAMIRFSSDDATGYILDRLTGTTSGPELSPGAMQRWLARRRAVNRYFAGLRWPELAACNATQKTWEDGPYGREHQSRLVPGNRNALTTEATARLLLAIDGGAIATPARCRAMRALLARRLTHPAAAENQVKGFLGEGLPSGSRVWSKAGWTSRTRHDAAIIALSGGPRFVLVVFTEGRNAAADTRRLPAIAAEAARLLQVFRK